MFEQYLISVVRPLVKFPDSVSAIQTSDEMGLLLTLSLHKDDMGLIIGKSGETAKAVRLLLRVIGGKNNARVSMKINEPEGSTKGFKINL